MSASYHHNVSISHANLTDRFATASLALRVAVHIVFVSIQVSPHDSDAWEGNSRFGSIIDRGYTIYGSIIPVLTIYTLKTGKGLR